MEMTNETEQIRRDVLNKIAQIVGEDSVPDYQLLQVLGFDDGSLSELKRWIDENFDCTVDISLEMDGQSVVSAAIAAIAHMQSYRAGVVSQLGPDFRRRAADEGRVNLD